MFPAWRLSSSPPWKIRNIIGLHSPPWLWVSKYQFYRGVLTFQGWIWMDLKNHPSSPSPTQPAWSNGPMTGPPGCVSSVILRMVSWNLPCQIQGVLFPGKDWTHRKSPQTGKPGFNHRLEMGKIRDLFVSMGSSISTRMMKNIVSFIKPSALKNVGSEEYLRIWCGYVNSQFDGYTQVITWNPGSMWNFRGWKARALFLAPNSHLWPWFF